MKKVTDFLKPNILIILGAILFLYFLNYLSLQEEGLAIGIIAVVISTYYLAVGILGVVIGNKLSPMLKKIFEIVAVCLFGTFMFLLFLLTTIQAAQIEDFMGPTSWTIAILSMVASLSFVSIYVAARLVKKDFFMRFAYLFSAIFVLALLLDILFDVQGNGVALGGINVLLVVIYVIFTIYLFDTLKNESVQQLAPSNAEEKKNDEPASAEKEEVTEE